MTGIWDILSSSLLRLAEVLSSKISSREKNLFIQKIKHKINNNKFFAYAIPSSVQYLNYSGHLIFNFNNNNNLIIKNRLTVVLFVDTWILWLRWEVISGKITI